MREGHAVPPGHKAAFCNQTPVSVNIRHSPASRRRVPEARFKMFWPPTNTVASKEKDGVRVPRETTIPAVPSLPPRLLNKVLT